MNVLYKILSICAAISLLLSACSALSGPVEKESPPSKAAVYESILDKPLMDEVVADFISSNNCSRTNQFLLCTSVGMALWTDANQVVESVYLYLNDIEDFEPYQGELPFGLKFYDTMAAVEYKLNRQGIGNAGLPDASATPDHMYYQATYREAGLMIIYNYPFPDEGATIRAVVITNKKGMGFS